MFKIFRKVKPFDYPGIEPPFEFKPFHEMTDEEARRHFDWFVMQSEPRRKLLLEMIEATGGQAERCDYTPESLVTLWNSVIRFFEKREMTADEKEAVFQNAPNAARQIRVDLSKLTTATRCLAIDIGFYVAEVFIRKFPEVQWDVWTQKGEGEPLNRPVLTGFKLPLIPSDTVIGSIGKHFKNPKKTLLFDVFKVWEKDLTERQDVPASRPGSSKLPAKGARSRYGFPPKVEGFFGEISPTGSPHDPGWDFRLWIEEWTEDYLGTEQFASLERRFASTPGIDKVVQMDREVFLIKARISAEQLREVLWHHFVEAAFDAES